MNGFRRPSPVPRLGMMTAGLAAVTALVVGDACTNQVNIQKYVDGDGGAGVVEPGGGGAELQHTTTTSSATTSSTTTSTSSSGVAGAAPSPCSGPESGSCSSDSFPAGESCEECFCRCCDHAVYMEPCLASPACAAYVDCVVTCADGPPCAAGCELPCDTGMEPGCYLADCHNWVCSHGCGLTY